jgi:hypothetical protein
LLIGILQLDNLTAFPEHRIHALFGLQPEVLAEVMFRVLPGADFFSG